VNFDPLFLTLDEIAQPRQTFGGEYLHADLAAMAAAYLFQIVMDHPFEDGNKRTGTHAALVFLGINDYDLDPLPDDAEQFICSVAAGKTKKEEVIEYFRSLMK
jgi:death on curing protein